jgi:hypothetical protein
MRPQPDSSKTYNRRIVFTIISIVLVLLVVMGVVFVKDKTAGNQTRGALSPTAMPTQNGMVTLTPIPNAAASPLLFGTNLGLFTSNDQVVTSASTRALMQQMHIRIVRVPMRKHISKDVEIQAFQAVKSIGAIPLVVLNGVRNPNVLVDDTLIIQDVNSVFAHSLVYYEFGNEDDWNGVTIAHYTEGWNTYIPQFKHLALNGKFIGPVSYQYDHNNLTMFLQGANPRPDAISWHEYTCSYRDPANHCLAHLDRWTTHINDGRSAMQATLGTELPIMITEWNYAADQSIQHNGLPFDDGKYNNASFITAWTTKALDILAANQVFASMQYSVTNTALPLISDNNSLTLQGITFQSLYQKMVHDPSGT